MRVVSWNVNGIRACVRHGFVDFLGRSGADIVGVQEVRALPEEIPPVARTPAGWHAAFSVAERRGYSGVGIYSKFEPYRVETSLGEPRFDVEGRFIAAYFRTDRGRFAVVNGYFPKGSGKDRDNSRVGYKLAFYRAVFDRAQLMRRRCPVLVMGDYNTAHREIDLARPKSNVRNSGFLPEERSGFDRWLEAGWVDTFRALHPDEPGHYKAEEPCSGLTRCPPCDTQPGISRTGDQSPSNNAIAAPSITVTTLTRSWNSRSGSTRADGAYRAPGRRARPGPQADGMENAA